MTGHAVHTFATFRFAQLSRQLCCNNFNELDYSIVDIDMLSTRALLEHSSLPSPWAWPAWSSAAIVPATRSTMTASAFISPRRDAPRVVDSALFSVHCPLKVCMHKVRMKGAAEVHKGA